MRAMAPVAAPFRKRASLPTFAVAAAAFALVLFACGDRASREEPTTFKSFRLPNGVDFECWVSEDNHAGQPTCLYSTLEDYPLQYRISKRRKRLVDWKPMVKSPSTTGSDDEDEDAADSAQSASESLPAGRYAVDFRAETRAGQFQDFRGVTVQVN